MLLGKRPRPPMRRTTSMTEFTLDISGIEGMQPQPSDQRGHQKTVSDGGAGRRQTDGYMTAVSPKSHRRGTGDFLETAPFLRACGLCKRRLAPGRDIYMYRGDTAFCSLECRQQQMNQDERREKCSLASIKKEVASSNTSGSDASNNGETVAAA
ncbi:FCS-Like Zinc finger 7-like [Magnolia sinica]|uniref:FCS-Like Zinc finger 7-like n=1 Tax=Magnolia sinica TaxID=86752 RepID=UPI0026583B2C|nr:FCS-Like Zinc finger 7-like [Magnolia sinica]